MYINGSKFNDVKGDESCYLPLFRNRDHLMANDTWTFGNIFMNQYYFTFDMTPLTEQSENYLRVGIGRKNPEDVIGKGVIDKAQEMYQ